MNDSTDPPFLTEPTVVTGPVTGSLTGPVDEPVLARALDWCHRYRLGFVVLAPLILGMAVLAYANQAATEQGPLQARGQGSAVLPLVEGVFAAAPRSGAAAGSAGPARLDDLLATARSSSGTDEAEAEPSSPRVTELATGSASPAPDPDPPSIAAPATEPATTAPQETTSPETASPETKPATTAAPETTPPESAPPQITPLETKPPQTKPPETKPAETTPLETKPPQTKPPETKPPETTPAETKRPETKPPETKPPETTQPETRPVKAVCTVEVKGGKKLRAAPSKKAEELGKVDRGVYVVGAASGSGKSPWYQVVSAGTTGWVKHKDTEKDSYQCV